MAGLLQGSKSIQKPLSEKMKMKVKMAKLKGKRGNLHAKPANKSSGEQALPSSEQINAGVVKKPKQKDGKKKRDHDRAEAPFRTDGHFVKLVDTENQVAKKPKMHLSDDLQDSFNIEPVVEQSKVQNEKKPLSEKKKAFLKKKRSNKRRITDVPIEVLRKPAEPTELLDFYVKHLESKSLSQIEMDDYSLSPEAFQSPIKKPDEMDIAQCLSTVGFQPESLCKASNQAAVLIACSAAIRCCELIKLLRSTNPFSYSCNVSKMFSLHIKVQEQAAVLRKQSIHVCVGTPARLRKLYKEGILGLENLQYLVVDYNHRDSKYKRVVDINETRVDMLELMMEISSALKAPPEGKIVLF